MTRQNSAYEKSIGFFFPTLSISLPNGMARIIMEMKRTVRMIDHWTSLMPKSS